VIIASTRIRHSRSKFWLRPRTTPSGLCR
jgi:hypothetical protein